MEQNAPVELAPGPETPGTIIFDWDDTLCPTWFIKHVKLEGVPAERTVAQALQPDVAAKFMEMHSTEMAVHTQAVCELLREARKVARVCIVTLGNKSWIDASIVQYMKGQGLQELLTELDIEIINAPEVPKSSIGKPVEMQSVARKNIAFVKSIAKLCPAGVRCNVMSIGDSQNERIALKQVMSQASHADDLCKTVKLPGCPLLSELTLNVRKLLPLLSVMVAHPESFDFDGPPWDFPPPIVRTEMGPKKSSSAWSMFESVVGKTSMFGASNGRAVARV